MKIPLGWNLKGFQHADEGFSCGYDGAGAELDLFVNLLQFIGNGQDLAGFGQGACSSQIQQDVEAVDAVGIVLQLPEMIDYFGERNHAIATGANRFFFRIDGVGYWHVATRPQLVPGQYECQSLPTVKLPRPNLHVNLQGGIEVKVKSEVESKVKSKVKGSGQECPPYKFLRRDLNNGKPHALAASSAPNRITASMLDRPSGDQ